MAAGIEWTVRREDYAGRLAIVVPYRDRADHLRQLIPHLRTFFERDKLHRHIAYSIHIVEPTDPGPFNRGRVKNAGFALARPQADYVCFHDVDYLPIWADYSYTPQPARLLWYGTTLQENYERLFGGVIAFNCADFERVNGYSNDYWGWGYEDTDLLQRCQRGGLTIERRDGTFVALPHAHAGYRDDDSPSEESEAMRALFEAKQAEPEQARLDGLGSVRFELVDTRQGFDENGRPLNHIHHHRIRWT